MRWDKLIKRLRQGNAKVIITQACTLPVDSGGGGGGGLGRRTTLPSNLTSDDYDKS